MNDQKNIDIIQDFADFEKKNRNKHLKVGDFCPSKTCNGILGENYTFDKTKYRTSLFCVFCGAKYD